MRVERQKRKKAPLYIARRSLEQIVQLLHKADDEIALGKALEDF